MDILKKVQNFDNSSKRVLIILIIILLAVLPVFFIIRNFGKEFRKINGENLFKEFKLDKIQQKLQNDNSFKSFKESSAKLKKEMAGAAGQGATSSAEKENLPVNAATSESAE